MSVALVLGNVLAFTRLLQASRGHEKSPIVDKQLGFLVAKVGIEPTTFGL